MCATIASEAIEFRVVLLNIKSYFYYSFEYHPLLLLRLLCQLKLLFLVLVSLLLPLHDIASVLNLLSRPMFG